jgi:hypothetical protein
MIIKITAEKIPFMSPAGVQKVTIKKIVMVKEKKMMSKKR